MSWTAPRKRTSVQFPRSVRFPPIVDIQPRCQARFVGADELIVREALERLGSLIRSRDLAFADEFDPTSFLLVGSEAGEVASSRTEMEGLLARIYVLPVRVSWEWEEVIAKVSGDVALVFAEGHLFMSGRDGISRKPYRMSGVLQRSNDRWLWRLFHGAEPAQP